MNERRLEVQEHDSIGGLSAREWDDSLQGDDFYLSERWLAVVEDNLGSSVRYGVLTEEGKHRAGLSTATADTSSPWVLGRPDGLVQEALDAGLPMPEQLNSSASAAAGSLADMLLPSLVCGGRHMGPTRIAGSNEEDDVTTLVEWALKRAQDKSLRSISFPFVNEDDTTLRKVLARLGFSHHLSARYAVLDIPDGGWTGYLASLPGKRRRRVLADERQLRAAQVVSKIVPLAECDLEDLGRLEAALMAKYGVAWSPRQTVAALQSSIERFGAAASVVLSEANGTVVGFVVLHRWRNSWFTRQAGFDYEVNNHPPLYFEAMYYVPVRAAAELGITTIYYGSGNEDAKQSRGCHLVNQYQYAQVLDNGPAVEAS